MDWQRCLGDYSPNAGEDADFATAWLDFSVFRSIPFTKGNWEI
jgi:hypothetical protein